MKKFAHLKLRSELFRSIRNYFYDHGFIEVETPVKIHAPAPEEFIESVRSEDDFLRTSPELAMKVLLSEGMDRIFQIGSCFRANEFGRRHREEFTMLEFYEQGIGYREQALFTAGYIARTAREVLGPTRQNRKPVSKPPLLTGHHRECTPIPNRWNFSPPSTGVCRRVPAVPWDLTA